MNRSDWNRAALAAGAGLTGLLAWHMLAEEPYRLEQTHHTWRLSRLPRELDGLTICQITDPHARKYGRRERMVADLLEGSKADLVVLTGDYGPCVRSAEVVADLARRVRSRFGHFAVWGNHEYLSRVDLPAFRRIFEQNGITVLENEHRLLTIQGATFALVGIDSLDAGRADFARATRGIEAGMFRLLLAHHPDAILLAADHDIDLQLSGHTHGGQVRLPLIGAPYVPSRFRWSMDCGVFDSERLKQVTGHHGIPTLMYVSRGIGTSGLPIRLLCRPEIAWHTLRSRME